MACLVAFAIVRIVHGDLKPDNLLMSSSGKVKISDFGSARFCEKSDMIFATAGTPSFMAPEMCQGKPGPGTVLTGPSDKLEGRHDAVVVHMSKEGPGQARGPAAAVERLLQVPCE